MGTTPDPARPDHESYIRRCLELAAVARGEGNTPVGSLVVLGELVVGEAWETLPAGRLATGHAELLACQAALDRFGRRDLDGAALYTTAEPCFMCAFVARQLRVATVVYGAATPLIGGVTSGHPILTDPALDHWRPAPRVVGGILADECAAVRIGPTPDRGYG